jgi:hypothetical protein
MDTAGGPADSRRMAGKSLLCSLGMHRWKNHYNDEGQRYITCERCGKDSEKITLNDSGLSF